MTDTHLQAEPVATTVAGDVLIFVVCPLIVALVIGAVTLSFHLTRRIGLLEQGLAILVSQMSPPGSPALRDLVQAQAVEVANLRGLVTASLTPNVHGKEGPPS